MTEHDQIQYPQIRPYGDKPPAQHPLLMDCSASKEAEWYRKGFEAAEKWYGIDGHRYTRAEIRNGTGFPPDARFVQVSR